MITTKITKRILTTQTLTYHLLSPNKANFSSDRIRTTRRRFGHTSAHSDPDNNQLHFPGGVLGYSSQLRFIPGSNRERVPCYRVLDDDGSVIPGSHHAKIGEDLAVKIYKGMATLQIMDNIFYESQRQGRLSFYLTSTGEEAVNLASAAALSFKDVVFAQYREPGVLLWRGFSILDFANQLFGNNRDLGKGKQMPIHYGSNKHNYVTISSPLATQLPQAVGAAYSLKMHRPDTCAVAFFGDGATSEGDFHAAMNFAAVLEAPVVFICRNNGWAISTQSSEQFKSDGVVVKGAAYGIESIRVDGNDAVAVYSAIAAARATATSERRPVLVEAMTYRVGHHSTSDDSSKYRLAKEMDYWKADRDPVSRLKKWVEINGWWDATSDSLFRSSVKTEVLNAIAEAEKIEKPSLSEMFCDVYDRPTKDLMDQKKHLLQFVDSYPNQYPADVPVW